MIDAAKSATEDMRKATAELKTQLDRQESMRVKNIMQGKANVNVEQQEESPEDYAKRVMKNEV